MAGIAQPVLTIGIPLSSRLERVLPSLDVPYVIHLSSHYPSSFSNGADRNPRPEHHAGQQQSLPSIGSSCGLLADDRHSLTLGSYIRLSSSPKKIYILTAPLNIGPSMLLTTGSVVTQPSVADRGHLNASEDMYWRDVLKQDPQQTAAVASRRDELEKTFELARTVGSASGVQSTSKEELKTNGTKYFDFVWDGSQPKKWSSSQSLARPSDSWAILEITRETTIMSLSHTKKRWPFRGHTQSAPHPLIPGLTVSKKGRTTGYTIGTVNGARSLYRLPRDGPGIRRYDYAIVSYPWGGSFGFPGDAGAIILAHQRDGVEDKKVKHIGKPCALLVASSTSGHVSFVQDLGSVVAGVKRAGLGNMEFMKLSE
jgi:hypothetical protein